MVSESWITMPRVAVNIVTWNNENTIDATLRSLSHQTFDDFAVTVFDNASTDRTLTVLQAWQEQGVQVVCNPENQGFARAHNAGIRQTDSEFVLLGNPDVIMTPKFMAEMVQAVDANRSVGSAAGKLLQVETMDAPATRDEEGQVIDSAGLTMFRNRRQYLRGYQERADTHCLDSTFIFGPDGAAPIYRREMLEDVQIEGEYFDELFHTHKEDVDLAWRAQLLGWKSMFNPRAVAYHIRSFRPSRRQDMDASVKRIAVRNRWLMIAKNDLIPLYVRHLPWIAVYEFGMLGYALLMEQSSLPAWFDFLRLMPSTFQRRRLVQQRRRVDWQYMEQWFN